MLLALLPCFASPVSGPDCPACAAVANELERQMHEEWSHLDLISSDQKRIMARNAVEQKACDEAVQKILSGICEVVKGYASANAGGEHFYQKINHAEEREIVITGSVTIGASANEGLESYCAQTLLIPRAAEWSHTSAM